MGGRKKGPQLYTLHKYMGMKKRGMEVQNRHDQCQLLGELALVKILIPLFMRYLNQRVNLDHKIALMVDIKSLFMEMMRIPMKWRIL